MTSATLPAENESVSFELPPPPPQDAYSFELSPPAHTADDSVARERREKKREVIRVRARIAPDGESPLDVHTVDLSAHGLAITSARPLNVDQVCIVEIGISVPEIARPPALRASVRYCARLREDQFRIGMKFTDVSVEAAELIVAVLEL
jgi:PilZ domain-containing protein